MKKIKKIHIAIIVAGIVFNIISIFHPNLWFDEAYSVGIASKSFTEIWRIGSYDVHPVLYYWILHIIYLITNWLGMSLNGTIIAYRVFSAICMSILGILGYTHIRKDFGERTGVFFSFFTYFLPITCIYTAEIRMYSLAILLVTVLAIYAYRIGKNIETSNAKNWVIFGLSSLCAIYTHYYGLMGAGLINLGLFLYLIREKRVKDIITIVILGVLQLLAYIPWILCLLSQMKVVSDGYWIEFEFPETLFQLTGAHFSGNMPGVIGFIPVIPMYIYLFYRVYKARKNGEDYKIRSCSFVNIYFCNNSCRYNYDNLKNINFIL